MTCINLHSKQIVKVDKNWRVKFDFFYYFYLDLIGKTMHGVDALSQPMWNIVPLNVPLSLRRWQRGEGGQAVYYHACALHVLHFKGPCCNVQKPYTCSASVNPIEASELETEQNAGSLDTGDHTYYKFPSVDNVPYANITETPNPDYTLRNAVQNAIGWTRSFQEVSLISKNCRVSDVQSTYCLLICMVFRMNIHVYLDRSVPYKI